MYSIGEIRIYLLAGDVCLASLGACTRCYSAACPAEPIVHAIRDAVRTMHGYLLAGRAPQPAIEPQLAAVTRMWRLIRSAHRDKR